MRRAARLLLIATLVLLAPVVTAAQSPHRVYLPAIASSGGTVSGTLSVDAGPVVDATLYLGEWLKDETGRWSGVGYDRMTSPRTWTDEDGAFTFAGIPAGRYSLVLDRIMAAYLLRDPRNGAPLYVDVANGTYGMGELVYPELPE